jgi:putative oxidoreductase
MRDVALLGTRLVVGSYLAVHGAQKLFGAFGGPGLEKAGAGFHRIGLRPGKHMAAAAGITELGGGVLHLPRAKLELVRQQPRSSSAGTWPR